MYRQRRELWAFVLLALLAVSATCADGWQGPDCLHCGGKIRLVEPFGYIHDGPGNYSVNAKCSWLIEAAHSSDRRSKNATIRLHLEEFATECGWDHLYIYDGDSVESPLLAVFSGLMYKDSYAVRSVPEVMTRSGSALLHFFSDDAYNMSGFNISYAINACPSRYSSLNCSGHGICEDSVCKCHDGWMGKACDRPRCPDNCSYAIQQGMCVPLTQSCQCNPGFGGHDCSQPVKYGVWAPVEVGSFKPAGSASHGATVWRDSLYIVSGEGYGRSHLLYTYDFNGGVWEILHSSSSIVPNPRYGTSAVIHGDKIFLYGGVVTEHYHENNNHQRHHARHGSTSHFRDVNGHFSHALPSGNRQNSASQENLHQEHTSYGSAVNKVTNELWAFDISAKIWENITVRSEPCNKSIAMCGPLHSAGHSATLVALSDSSSHRKPTEKMIVIFGHSPQFGYLNTVQEYNFGTGEWSIIQTKGYPVKGGYGHTAAFDRLTEKIYVYGGIVSESESNQILNSNLYSYDPATRIWTLLAPAPSARFLHTANFIMPGMMIVFGGNTHNDTSHSFGAKCYSNELLSYDVVCDAWHYMSIPNDLRDNLARYGHSGTVFEGSLYLFGGFDGQMLNDMIQFTPGRCHHLSTQFDCLNSHPGIKCIWDVNRNKCINVTEDLKDYLRSSDPEFESSYIKCPEEGRDKITPRMLSHKDRCSLQTDCTSCVQTSYNCVWCTMGICTNERCNNSNYHTTNQIGMITTLEECPVESGPVCAQFHSCIACVSASSTSQVSGQSGSTHSTASAQQNRVQDSTSGSRSGMIAPSSHIKLLYGNSANSMHQMQCHWDYDTAKCRAGNSNSPGDNQEAGNMCTASCADFTSCMNCTQEECIWCQNEARCVDRNAYTASFPYGQCREWTTLSNRCRIPPNLDNNIDGISAGSGISRTSSCAAYASCSSCREDPACGWCDNGSRTGLGICLSGGAAHPTATNTCLRHTWYFTHCPSCQCNGHSTCPENSSVCIQPCGNHTMGQHCEKCSPGFWGNPLNGGKCQPCECNNQATLCNPDSGKCYCTTKGLAGDRCDKCDATNRYHGDPTNKGFCYYDLAVDYQFTFNLSKKEDRHYTQINFRNSPTKPDIDVDFTITCSVLAKMNITIITANRQEKTIFHSVNCTTFSHRFAKADHNFGIEDNITLTMFHVYVYDFQTPLWIQISFSQYPKLNLQ